MNVNKYPVSTEFIESSVKETTMASPKAEWLKEIKESVRHRYSARLDEFLEWVKKARAISTGIQRNERQRSMG